MSDTRVTVVICSGGHIRESERGPDYCDGRKTIFGVHKSITLSELKDKISTRILFNLDENEMDIKCRWPLDQQTYTIVDIESNEATSLMLNLSCTPVLYVGKGGLRGIPKTDSVHHVLDHEHHVGYAMSQNVSEFHNFDEERTSDKYQCGQIWALYSDIDMYPKYYGRINKIDSRNFEVHLTCLELCPVLDLEKIWLREGMPIGCGRFRVTHETVQFDSAYVFSHLVQAKQTGIKDQYDIYPCIGEVWAVYKFWHFTWQEPSDLVDCAFDIVEILEQTGSGIRVLLLEKFPGQGSVFIPPSRRGRSKLIPADEYLRFSHRIPAFKLSEENRGVFRGFWELDSASVPEDL